MPTLHQFVPTLDPGAVGSHILEIQRTLRAGGWDSEVFSEHTRPPYDGLAHRFTEYGRSVAANDDDVVVYHAAIGSTVADWLMARRPKRFVVDYHNITPPSWFDGWEPAVSYGLGWGRAQLRKLARRARFGLADSAYNAAELEAVGFRSTAVLPILIPPESLGGASTALARGPGMRMLFVGRVAPNKRQHLLIGALAAVRRVYDPEASLVLVGGPSSDAYLAALRAFARDLDVSDGVTFAGAVSDGERNGHYEASDVFVCLSGHEGFCVPLLEAWHHRLPIVAFAGTAVTETLGDAGLALHTTAAPVVAAAVARVATDPVLAEELRQAGTARLETYSIERARDRLLELASGLAGGLADRPGLRELLAR